MTNPHWRCAASFHDIAFLDGVCLPARQLLPGRPVRFGHDQAFVEPPAESEPGTRVLMEGA